MGFADNLRKLRLMNKWTQVELGEKSGINPKTLSSYEKGRTEPNLGEVIKLCSVFDCSISFLTGTKEREPDSITIEDILFKLNSLDDDTLRKLEHALHKVINQREERRMMEHEKDMLQKQIYDYESRIAELTRKLEEGD